MRDAYVLLGRGSPSGAATMLQLIGQRGALRGVAPPAVERLERRLQTSRQRHRDLGVQVAQLDVPGWHGRSTDVARLKKLRLHEKDRVEGLVSALRREKARAEQPAFELGRGAYGRVLLARSLEARGRLAAVKIAPHVNNADSELGREAAILSMLSGEGHSRFPRPLFHGRQAVRGEDCEVLVMELLGPSVDALWWAASGGTTLPAPCALRLGVGMLRCLAAAHTRGWTHNDVKPANFCMGLAGRAARRIHLVDFGCCAPLPSGVSTGAAAPTPDGACEPDGSIEGTLAFASVARHLGAPTCESDDAASLVYSLSYLMRGGLPWERLEQPSAVLEAKQRCSSAELSVGLPREAREALAAVWDHAELARRADATFDHEACVRALHAALAALEPATRGHEDEGEGSDTLVQQLQQDPVDFDWDQLGIGWSEDGDIQQSDGTILHAVGVASTVTPADSSDTWTGEGQVSEST